MLPTTSTPSIRLYFAPLACSLATRIACYEGDIALEYVEVDTKRKRLVSGGDFTAINPMGQVPVLEVEPGVLLSENTAVLQYVADRFPEAGLAPASGFERSRLQQWLGFIGTELHKAVFVPLLDPKLPAAAKDSARDKVALRLAVVEHRLADHPFLLDRYSVADAYLVTILNWAAHTQVDLTAWPTVDAYYRRMVARPRTAAAIGEEYALWKGEQARRAAA